MTEPRAPKPHSRATTVPGNGIGGFSGDGGVATKATLNSPGGVAVDAAGNLYIADTFNNRIRKLSARPSSLLTHALRPDVTDQTLALCANPGTDLCGSATPALDAFLAKLGRRSSAPKTSESQKTEKPCPQ